jgi:[acyl-carrier-protein] S-malonyltransferase
MSKKIAYLFPGQGSQYVGMGKDFYSAFPIAKKIFDRADEILGFSLTDIIFQGIESDLKQTQNAQLGIFVLSIAIMNVLEEKFPVIKPFFCAGLSAGEYTALCASGKLSFDETLLLVQKRASFMMEDCRKIQGTMAAVLGLDRKIVEEVVARLRSSENQEENQIWVANYNTPVQQVISGTLESVRFAAKLLEEKGAKKVLILDVFGAFHSPLMLSAQERVKDALSKISFQEGRANFVMNIPACVVKNGDEIKNFLEKQVTGSVLWEDSMRTMNDSDLFIEMGCGKTLNGMNRKIGVSAPTISIEKVEDLSLLEKFANVWENG